MIKDVYEFKSKTEADKVLAALDKANGYPMPGNVTQTTARVEKIGTLYYIESQAIDKTVDLSKATVEKLEKTLTGTTLTRQKKVDIKPI